MGLGTFFSGDVKCDWCGCYIKNTDGGLGGALGLDIVKRGIAASYKHYCSRRCKLAAEQASRQAQNSTLHNSDSSYVSHSPEDYHRYESDDVGNVASEGEGALSGIGSMLGKSFSGMGSIVQDSFEDIRKGKVEIETIKNMKFGDDANEVASQLQTLITAAEGLPTMFGKPIGDSKPKAKIIKTQMEFGLMKLRSLGKSTEADFFEKKMNEGVLSKI